MNIKLLPDNTEYAPITEEIVRQLYQNEATRGAFLCMTRTVPSLEALYFEFIERVLLALKSMRLERTKAWSREMNEYLRQGKQRLQYWQMYHSSMENKERFLDVEGDKVIDKLWKAVRTMFFSKGEKETHTDKKGFHQGFADLYTDAYIAIQLYRRMYEMDNKSVKVIKKHLKGFVFPFEKDLLDSYEGLLWLFERYARPDEENPYYDGYPQPTGAIVLAMDELVKTIDNLPYWLERPFNPDEPITNKSC